MRKLKIISIALILLIANVLIAAEKRPTAPNISKIDLSDGTIELRIREFYLVPHSNKLLFTDPFRLYVADRWSSKEARLVDQTVMDFRPSPDGEMIAYIQTTDDVTMMLFIVGIDGSGKKLLWSYKLPPRHDLKIKGWSSNGKEILVKEKFDGIDRTDEGGLYSDEDIYVYKISKDKGLVERKNAPKQIKNPFRIERRIRKVEYKNVGLIEQPFFSIFFQHKKIFSGPGALISWENEIEWEPEAFSLGNGEVLINAFFPSKGNKPPYFYDTTAPEQSDGQFKLVLLKLANPSKPISLFADSNALAHFTQSPDKKFFTYTNPRNHIWITSKDGKMRIKAIFEKDINPESIQWAVDSKSFFVLSTYNELYHVVIPNN